MIFFNLNKIIVFKCKYFLILLILFLASFGSSQNILLFTQYRHGTLHGAVERNNYEEVVRLLNEGESINKLVRGGLNNPRAPLHIAADKGYVEISKLLIERKANVNIVDVEKKTPLHLATFNGHQEIMELLINNKANLNSMDIKGSTPLHTAVINGWDGYISATLLIEAGADIKIRDSYNHAPLHTAVISCTFEAVEVLLKNGADVNSVITNKKTPLHLASSNLEYEPSSYDDYLISDIMKKVDTISWIKSNDPIDFYGHADKMIKLLLEYNADCTMADSEGALPIHYAAFFGNNYAFKVLLDHMSDNNIEIEMVDNNGFAPMHWAALNSDKSFVELLFKKGASTIIINKENGKTPLHMSAFNGRYETSKFLIDNGADINAKDNNGFTPLDYAKKYGNNQVLVQYLVSEL